MMEIILVRGTYDAGKTTISTLAYEELAKSADEVFLFNHYNDPIANLQYNPDNGEVYDFKAVLKIKGKIVVVITAGDEPWRLMINIDFLIDFVKKTFKVKIDILICCGRSSDKEGSVIDRLKKAHRSAVIHQVWTYKVDKALFPEQNAKRVKEIVGLVQQP